MTIKENPNADYIALFHPTGKLWMLYDNGTFEFEFDGLQEDPEEELIEIIAQGLSITNRFGGQSREPLSVLTHSLCVGTALQEAGEDPSVVFKGLMHDGTEAFIADIPRPFKTEQDRLREEALNRQFPWELMHEDLGVPVHSFDTIACAVEANKYGAPEWTWPLTYAKNFLASDRELYRNILEYTSTVPLDEQKEIWKDSVIDALNSL